MELSLRDKPERRGQRLLEGPPVRARHLRESAALPLAGGHALCRRHIQVHVRELDPIAGDHWAALLVNDHHVTGSPVLQVARATSLKPEHEVPDGLGRHEAYARQFPVGAQGGVGTSATNRPHRPRIPP